ncbi:winged helix-turn-helix domain-containing protein [Streptomyces sp. RB6PN25]|uniref:Winged helix-turn-helix domain-containing protein n=1 Tax=Streptomyces humicola TaxID=2953240 RepID=A0ABT1Q5Q0_9ACTN|nr:BTAD domain-containing putative transcriptional regulator [Streptomyces humicola]MCQ4084698.1 winged helix-turn-helix domain-containing protein [Streptomyces humicola]
MRGVRYCILGPTRAHRDDGTAVPLGGARLRALLAALALRPGRVLPAGTLIDEVWDGEPPADAAGALQALIARLRRALGREAIGSVDGGYRLQAATDDVDLYRFERLTADAARALADGDPAKAAGLLDDAHALWDGGAPLADLPDRAAHAGRAEVLHAKAVRLRLTADAALGNAERVLPELEALCAAHPLDEQLHALRIRTLRDAGRTAEALAAYEQIRAAIAEGLGADPGPELRALHAELLGPPAHTPAISKGVVGKRVVGKGNLRARLTSFVGREGDLAALRDDLAASRLVTLTGPGGSGKTRLSQEAADRYGQRWPDGAWLAELAPVADGRTVPEVVLSALRLRETAIHAGSADRALADAARHQDALATLTEYCSSRQLLLVLDNCEHLIGACAGLAERLLVHCPQVTVLATSREPLGVPGESVRPVDPLPEPTALRLLADRGASARPGFDPDDDPEACAEICRRLDGLPLALELAAARLRSLTPRQIADRLDDRFRLLTAGSRTLLPRQQTLRAVVDWSWELLEAGERTLLRRLSVFSGGCDLAAAEAVCGDAALDVRDVASLLGSLVDKSLVVADLAVEDGARYRMLETIAEYAAERLAEAGEERAVGARHIAYYREFARTADPKLRGREQLRWLERLEGEHDNIRAALHRAVDTRDEQEALQLVLSCSWFWSMRNYQSELSTWAREVAALGPDPFGDPPAPLLPLTAEPLDAPLPMPAEQLDEARRWLRLIQITATDNDLVRLSSTPDRARCEAMMAAYAPPLPQASSRAGILRPFASWIGGLFDEITRLLDELVDVCRAHGKVWELAFALQIRAKVLNDAAGRLAQSLDDARESRELFTRIGDRWGVAEALAAEAEAAIALGEFDQSAQCCREALAIARELGAHQQVPELTVRLGQALLNGGKSAEGERLIHVGIEDAERFGTVGSGARMMGRMLLILLFGRGGHLEEAHLQLDAMREELLPGTPGFVAGMLDAFGGWLAARAGDPMEGLLMARRCYDRLLGHPLSEAMAPRMGVVLMPLIIGVVAMSTTARGGGGPEAAAERARRGAVLLGAHHLLHPDSSSPMERQELEEAAGLLRPLLGDEAYEAAYAEGERLTAEEALAVAHDACR